MPADLEVHNWDTLVIAAGLAAKIKEQRTILKLYSALAESWAPAIRYRTKEYTPNEARELYGEIEELYEFLNELFL